MKTKLILTLAALILSPVHAAETHAHEKQEASPNGGRVITAVEPHLEFFVTEARKLQITFLGADGKPAARQQQEVTAIGGERANPTKFTFAKAAEGESLLSEQALPEGNMIPIVLQIKTTPDQKAVTTKFTINLADCPTCKHKEYACTCEH